MIEVECKIKVGDLAITEQKLLSLGFAPVKAVTECDTYYDNSDGYIRSHDSALRVRTTVDLVSDITRTEINFKGPKYDNITVTRPEYETSVQDEKAIREILSALGYHPVEPVVKKNRNTLSDSIVTACLDRVDGLGDYLELEIVISDETEKDSALVKIETILKSLGYTFNDSTTTSYLSALQRKNH